jgi:hypothetical protein
MGSGIDSDGDAAGEGVVGRINSLIRPLISMSSLV